MIYYCIEFNDSLTAMQNPAGETSFSCRIRFSDLATTRLVYARIDGAKVYIPAEGTYRCDAFVDLHYFNDDPPFMQIADVTQVSSGAAIQNGAELKIDTFKDINLVKGIPLVHGTLLIIEPTMYGYTQGVAVTSLQVSVTIGVENDSAIDTDRLSPELVYSKERERTEVRITQLGA